jgi:hypothetical protein
MAAGQTVFLARDIDGELHGYFAMPEWNNKRGWWSFPVKTDHRTIYINADRYQGILPGQCREAIIILKESNNG